MTTRLASRAPLVLSRTALLAAAAIGLAPTNVASADIYGHNNGPYDKQWGVNFMPDLDQGRSEFPIWGINGLPGDGAMYCYPTAVANIAAYTTWRGLGPWPASMNWSSSDLNTYNTATAHLAQLGEWMDTHPTNGTGYPGGYNGALQLFDAQIYFNVNYFKTNGSGNWAWSPKLDEIVDYGLSGGLVQICFGRYDWHWDAEDERVIAEERTGGHCLTLTRGTINPSGDNEIRFRDPGYGPSNTWTQSTFASHTRTVVDNFVDRMGTDVWMSVIIPYDGNVSGDEKVQIIDSVLVVSPTWGLIDPPPSGGDIVIETRPIDFNPATDLVPVQRPHAPSVPGAPIDFTMRPDRKVISYLYHLTPSLVALQTRDTASSVYGQPVTFTATVTPVGMAYSRFMELGVVTDRDLILYSTDEGAITELARVALPTGASPSAIAYNDTVDEFWILDAAAHRMHRFDHRLRTLRPFDMTPRANGDPLLPSVSAYSMTIDPRNGTPWIANELGELVAHYVPTSDGRGLEPAQVITGHWLHPTDAQFDSHGRLLIATMGGIWEYADTAGDGVLRRVEPVYSRLHPHRKFEVTISRSNELTPAAEVPGWRDDPIPGEFDEGTIIDCPGDFDGSGRVDSADFFAFLQAFFEGTFSADVNYNGTIDSADFFDFLTAFFGGC